jgi:hypothetical protein
MHWSRFLLAMCCAGAVNLACAQLTLDGLPRVDQWTDFENQAGELPVSPWGSCSAQQADRVGIKVDFQDGTSGFATYSGVASLWNTGDFPDILPDTVGGFFVGCNGIHFLFNNGTSLPLAWDGCSMAFSGNFDLDYIEAFGSNFRATTTGWVQADFQTYCGNGSAGPSAIPVPTLTQWSVVGLGALLAILSIVAVRRLRP